MPNGFHGERSDWDKMEAPLLRIDNMLEAFSRANGMRVRRNYHNWPERSLMWNTMDIEKLIQLFLRDEKKLEFTLWICAYEDR